MVEASMKYIMTMSRRVDLAMSNILKVYSCPCHENQKSLWSQLFGMEKKILTRGKPLHQLLRSVPICSSKDTTSGTKVAIGSSTHLSIQ